MQPTSLPQGALLWFGTVWIFGAVGSLYFWLGTNAEDKRQLYPWFMGLTLFAMLCFVYFGVHLPVFLVGLFAVFGTVGAVIHIRSTIFCPRCARMIYRGLLLGSVNYCPRCGQGLNQALDQSHTPARTE